MRSKLKWFSPMATIVGMLGCSDATMLVPTAPSPKPAASSSYDGSVPYFESEGEVPDWFAPRVLGKSPIVYWNGNEAVASSRMDYFGNRGEETFVLKISGASSDSRDAESASGGFWPEYRTHWTHGFTLAPDVCGHIANLTSQHTARTIFFVDIKGLTQLPPDEQPGGANKEQRPCAEEERVVDNTGGGGDCNDGTSCEDNYPTAEYCVIWVRYYEDTGEIIDTKVLYCY